MTRTLLALMMLAAAGAARADDARPSMPFFGTATMAYDDTLSIKLRSTADGKPADDTLIFKRGDRGYDNVLRHLGGLSPGETKPMRPWKD